ncbi:hypothetical protein E2C01_056303 [Portunus trituberculatus]|uniref:Uncharacterized protein n=1 Tax=Portunus trituberculatus TaxID=210409 RepID=A0A5B7GQ23_PORTR|nr:hypothetical protein [Portunus trituberculatus]
MAGTVRPLLLSTPLGGSTLVPRRPHAAASAPPSPASHIRCYANARPCVRRSPRR